jgi:WD40 repeat protein
VASEFQHRVRLTLVLSLVILAIGPLRAAPITTLAFSPDGSILVSNASRALALRSPLDGHVEGTLPCDLTRITSVLFLPQKSIIAASGGTPGVKGEVVLLHWPEGAMMERVRAGSDLAMQMAVDPGQNTLALAGADHVIRLWSLLPDGRLGEAPRQLVGHAGPVWNVAYSPKGDVLVSTSADRSVKVWSTADGRLLRTFTQHTESVLALAYRPRSAGGGDAGPDSCSTGGDDRTVRVWQASIGRMVRIVRQSQSPVLALAYSRDGSELYAAGSDGVIRCLDPDSDILRREIVTGGDWIYALAVSPDGSRLASGDWSGRVRLHEIQAAVAR